MSFSTILAISSLLAGLGAATIALFVPVPDTWHEGWQSFYIPLCTSVFLTVLVIGAATLFLSSLHAYKPQLRRIYRIIVVSLIINAIGVMQLPIINSIDGWELDWVTKGFIGLPFLMAASLMYGGVRGLVRLVKSPATLAHLYIAIPATVVGALLAFIFPHVPLRLEEIAFDMSNVVATACTLLYLWSAILLVQIKGRIGQHYARSIAWLSAALLACSAISVFITANSLLTGEPNGMPPATSAVMLTYVLLIVAAGYSFSQTTDYMHRATGPLGSLFSGWSLGGTVDNLLELVIQTAGLISQLEAIDLHIDKVRTISSRLGPDKDLSTKDEQVLSDVYLSLEQHLLTNETIRTFTRTELRQQLAPSLLQHLTVYETNKMKAAKT